MHRLVLRLSVAVGVVGLFGLFGWMSNVPSAEPASPQRTAMHLGDVSLTYTGFGEVRTNGNDSTYGQGLTHRHVDGELRFLTLVFRAGLGATMLHEFRAPGFGETVTEPTGEWDLSGTNAFLAGFHGIWYEQAKERLWITSATDYTAENIPARVTIVELGSGGRVSVQKQFFLDKPAKRVYGGCQAVPQALVAPLGGPYVCGWGGYTSLVMNGGNASIGPTMYVVPDPDTIENGERVDVRTVLDAADAQSHRGVRLTIPVNYFDGGDLRTNPPTRPEAPPASRAGWLSPNDDGLGWMVWGDSYYNTGFWIGTTYGAVANLCQGSCWYESSTLAFDGRQFELHLWHGEDLGDDRLERPAAMFELDLPRGNDRVWSGNVSTGNITGATYDSVGHRLYLLGFPFGDDDYTGRLFTYSVTE